MFPLESFISESHLSRLFMSSACSALAFSARSVRSSLAVALRWDGRSARCPCLFKAFNLARRVGSELGGHGVGMPNHTLEATAYRAPLRLLVRLGLFCLPMRLTFPGCASALIR